VQDGMEGCPAEDENIFFMILAAMLGLVLFSVYQTGKTIFARSQQKQATAKMNALKEDDEFVDLQIELYGEEVLNKSLRGTTRSLSRQSSMNSKTSSSNV